MKARIIEQNIESTMGHDPYIISGYAPELTQETTFQAFSEKYGEIELKITSHRMGNPTLLFDSSNEYELNLEILETPKEKTITHKL